MVTFSALETSHSLACTFYEFVKVCRCFYATNENIHVLSMKFPHLFLRPEIIITFLWGWEWGGGQVRHRSPRNSGFYCFVLIQSIGCLKREKDVSASKKEIYKTTQYQKRKGKYNS